MAAKEKEQYSRLCWLLVDAGTYALKKTFNSIYSSLSLKEQLGKLKLRKIILKLHRDGVITDKHWELLYPTGRRLVSSNQYTYDLLLVLFQNICHMSAPYPNGWDMAPLPGDHSLTADIVRIKLAIEELGRIDAVDDAEFQRIWSTTTAAIIRLGEPEVKVKLKRIETEILTMEFMQDQFIQQLKEVTRVLTSQQQVKQRRISRRHRRNDRSPEPEERGKSDKKETSNSTGSGIPSEDTIVLSKTLKLLVENVKVEDTLDQLQESFIINTTQRQKMMTIPKNAVRMRYLINIVQTNKIPQAFKLLCESIKNKYPQVYETIVKARHQIYKEGLANKPDVVGYCHDLLAQQYSSLHSQVTPLPWLHHTVDIKNLYVPLQIVNNKGDEISLAALLPQPRSERTSVTVVLGPAGCGKTSLCKMILSTWAHKPKYFHGKFDLLIYLDMRQTGSDLMQSIYDQILPKDFRISPADFKSILEANTKTLLFLLDGYESPSQNPELPKLVQGSIFRGSSILFIADPAYNISQLGTADTYLHCLGLADKNVPPYINRYAKLADVEDKVLEKFLFKLATNRHLFQLLKNPFISMSVVSSMPNSEDVTSITPVLQEHIRIITTKFCKEQGLALVKEQYPEDVKKAIKTMAKMAFESLIGGESVFATGNFEGEENAFMVKSGILISLGSGQEWTFHCSMVRDFLAAKYLTDKSFQEDLTSCLDQHKLLKMNKHAQTIKFLCGLLHRVQQESPVLESVFRGMASQNKRVTRGVSFLVETSTHDSEKILGKSKGRMSDFATSLGALVESNNRPDMAEILAQSLPPNIVLKGREPFSESTLMGLSSVLRLSQNIVTEVVFILTPLQEYQVNCLMELGHAICQNGHVKHLKIVWTSLHIMARVLEAALHENSSLESIHVERARTETKINSPRMPTKIPPKPKLQLNTSKRTAAWDSLQKASKNLQHVKTFAFLNCPHAEVMAQIIHHLPYCLPELNIDGCRFDMICAQELAYHLEHSDLKSLDISGVQMENMEFAAFLRGVTVSASLQVMRLAEVKLERLAFLALCNSLRFTKSIQHLDLSGCHLTGEMETRLSEVVRRIKSLRTLNLLNTETTYEGRSLLRSSGTKSLTVLGMEENSGLPPVVGGY